MASARVSALAGKVEAANNAARSPVVRLLKLITRRAPRTGEALLSAVRMWRTKGAVCALIACVLVPPGQVAAQGLWRGLPVGASVTEVKNAFPTATRPLAPTTLADGSSDDLTTTAFVDGDRFMRISFFFREGGLTAVMLTPPAVAPDRPGANLQIASAMAADFTARYGAPFDCGDASDPGLSLYRCKWLDGPIVIRLWYMDALGQAPILRVVYRKADDAAYDF